MLSAKLGLCMRLSTAEIAESISGTLSALFPGRQWRIQEFCSGGGGLNKFRWGQRAERMRIWGGSLPSQGFRLICKWMKPVLLLGCYGRIFQGTGNSVQLCQNFRNFGGFEPPKPPQSVNHYWKGYGRNRLWPNLRFGLDICAETLRTPVKMADFQDRFWPGASPK
jgi:hypothetical protein